MPLHGAGKESSLSKRQTICSLNAVAWIRANPANEAGVNHASPAAGCPGRLPHAGAPIGSSGLLDSLVKRRGRPRPWDYFSPYIHYGTHVAKTSIVTLACLLMRQDRGHTRKYRPYRDELVCSNRLR